jgi:UDP-2-acetamido-2,6-beta-L-arabino-hexul-4-ose reductase
MMNLLFVNDAVDVILSVIDDSTNSEYLRVEPTDKYKVSEVLTLLKSFKENYTKSGIQPNLNNKFEKNLFEVFKAYKL